ncbi:conserved hypothetical protein [Leishmania major strain Friedlin]|uniref:Uncharacterized protein n=1 Tax=Leishmania major TaxID=5664 RepID=Q4QCM0_LEIMA|nr:conserved hypothetical protein [Leishmania major strain Friedlin]CAJ04604.1 conserved hypothetical protein [Leishmania major strain Friedlin]|eukprot:XP_001682928.1 conserved hypothetical protein [Leishmania major strain Friedlin]
MQEDTVLFASCFLLFFASHAGTYIFFPLTMAPLSVAYISGTTLSQFLGAAFSCMSGRKYICKLYGFIQNVHEITDDRITHESRGVVILGATSIGCSDTSAGMQNMGYLTICHSPSHKLSYADTQKLQRKPGPGDATQQVLMHITSEMKSDGTARVLYSLYEVGVKPLMPLQLKVDNLVGVLGGFAKLSNAYARNVSLTAALPANVGAGNEMEMVEFEDPHAKELEALAREKADLTKRLLELNRKLSNCRRSEMS